jgi:hypothetical protein
VGSIGDEYWQGQLSQPISHTDAERIERSALGGDSIGRNDSVRCVEARVQVLQR